MTVREHLLRSESPVERDIAGLLAGAAEADGPAGFRRRRYQRKLDVARVVHEAYDEGIEKPRSARPLSAWGYLGLAFVFEAAALGEHGRDEASRARLLAWANSAYNALDRTRELAPAAAGHEAAIAALSDALDSLCSRGLAA